MNMYHKDKLSEFNSVSYRIFTHLAAQQLVKSTISKSTRPSPLLTAWPYGSKLLSWLPPHTYFETSWSLQQSVTLAPF
jgi:hypothetical protein